MKRMVFILLILLIIFSSIGAWFWHKHDLKAKAAKPPTPQVSIIKAQIKTIPVQIHALGQVIAPQTTILRNLTAGNVNAIYFQSGEHVKQNQLLVQIDPTQAKAAVAEQKANFEKLQSLYQRYTKLDEISKNSDLSANQLLQAKDNMLAAKAQLQAAKKQLANTQIRAPFSGTIGLPQAIANQISIAGNTINESTPLTVGTYLPVGSPIAVLTNTQNTLIQYQVPESLSGAIQIGQSITVHFLAYPNKTFQGKVTFISPIVFQNTEAYSVEASIQDPKQLLRSGMNASITQTINPNRKVLTIPGIALVPSLSGYSVYTIKDSKVQATEVKVGERFKNLVAITSGLKDGEAIIAEGDLFVQPGMTVKIKKS